MFRLAFLILLTAKAFGFISVSWWFVCLPLMLPVFLAIGLLVVGGIASFLVYLLGEWYG